MGMKWDAQAAFPDSAHRLSFAPLGFFILLSKGLSSGLNEQSGEKCRE
jgi:hypothetical protein